MDRPNRVAILGAASPTYELYCPNFTGMQQGLFDMGIEYQLFNIRPSTDVLSLEALKEFDPDLIIYGLIDMVKNRSLRLQIRRLLPDAKIVMWYGDLRNQETGQIRIDMSEVDAMFVSNAAQNEYYEHMWRVPECHFLPLGSQVYSPEYKQKFDFPCVFIGAVITGKGFDNRRNIMRELMAGKLINRIDGPPGKEKLRAQVMKEMPNIYHSSRLSLDWSHFTDIEGYTSNRFWIIPASAGVALTKRWPGCEEWYPEGTRIYFDSIDEFREKRAYFLKNENAEEREAVRVAGHRHAQKHTYEDRFARMFKILYGSKSKNRLHSERLSTPGAHKSQDAAEGSPPPAGAQTDAY